MDEPTGPTDPTDRPDRTGRESRPTDRQPPEAPGDLDVDPALAAAVHEVEQHLAGDGWNQPARLYALVETSRIVEHEPELAASMGLDDASAHGSLTPVEQDQLDASRPLERVLEQIEWPSSVSGCLAVVERLVLPPDVDDDVPDDPAEAERFAREHPDRQEVRIVAGATRAGATYCALRLRAHDDDQSVVGGSNLVPALVQLLGTTLEEEES